MEVTCSEWQKQTRGPEIRCRYSPCPRLDLPTQNRATHPLLMIGDDAADKAGVGVAQRGHETAQ
jgi:hypothetical protein